MPVLSGMRRPGPDEWKQLVAEFEASGLQQKEFVARHGLSLGAFQYRLYRKAQRRSERTSPRAAFLPVEVVASAAPPPRDGGLLELALPRGLLLRFPVGTDTSYLTHLLSALR
jgi:hypothetical protein